VNLSAYITTMRGARTLSRDQLAKAAGTTRQAIFEIETGKNWNLKTTAIAGLARGLRVRPEAVLEAAMLSLEESNGD
jgi:DNA-binding XRE family transcriptional regulator